MALGMYRPADQQEALRRRQQQQQMLASYGGSYGASSGTSSYPQHYYLPPMEHNLFTVNVEHDLANYVSTHPELIHRLPPPRTSGPVM